jgi:Rieske Fe-S protein
MIAGMLLTDLVQGRRNDWADTYDPSRKTVGAVRAFAQENLNVVAQYGDLVSPREVETTRSIRRGKGAVVRRGLTKSAVHRDERGELEERSAICPHLGCVVRWNRATARAITATDTWSTAPPIGVFPTSRESDDEYWGVFGHSRLLFLRQVSCISL